MSFPCPHLCCARARKIPTNHHQRLYKTKKSPPRTKPNLNQLQDKCIPLIPTLCSPINPRDMVSSAKEVTYRILRFSINYPICRQTTKVVQIHYITFPNLFILKPSNFNVFHPWISSHFHTKKYSRIKPHDSWESYRFQSIYFKLATTRVIHVNRASTLKMCRSFPPSFLI